MTERDIESQMDTVYKLSSGTLVDNTGSLQRGTAYNIQTGLFVQEGGGGKWTVVENSDGQDQDDADGQRDTCQCN